MSRIAKKTATSCLKWRWWSVVKYRKFKDFVIFNKLFNLTCILKQIIQQCDCTIVKSLLDRIPNEAGLQPNCNCSFVLKDQATTDQVTLTEMKIDPELTTKKNQLAIPKNGGKNKEKTDKLFTSTGAGETNLDDNTMFDMETD